MSWIRPGESVMISGMGGGKGIAPGLTCVIRTAAFASLFPLVLGGCFFTSDINTAPVAEITVENPGPLHKNDLVTFDALKSKDADGDPLTYYWLAMSCDSAMACDVPFSSQGGPGQTFTFKILDKRLVTVQLTVIDRHGAHGQTQTVIVPVNRPPTLTLQVQGVKNPDNGYTVGRKLTVAAHGDDADGDTLTYGDWIIEGPVGSQPSQIDLQSPSPDLRTFRPDVPGFWTVSASVDDGSGDPKVMQSVMFAADADQDPCIAATDPLPVVGARYVVQRGDGPRTFSVETVTDDLDPYPVPIGNPDADLGGAHFRWWIAGPDAAAPLVEVIGHDLHDLAVDPAAYTPGDLLSVRAEIVDRRAVWPACPVGDPTCSAGGDTCVQRVTWGVEIR